jgi:hypothetical protein
MEYLTEEAVWILEGVIIGILQEPELYDQNTIPDKYSEDSCRTPCCFAGWAAYVKGGRKLFDEILQKHVCIATLGLAEILGCSEELADELFYNWPGSIERPAWKNPRTKAAAEDGAEYLRSFIEKYSRPKGRGEKDESV